MVNIYELPLEFKSDYLETGFAQESIDLKNVDADLENRVIYADLKIINPYCPNYDGHNAVSHLSDLTAYRALGQLIIGYNCLASGLTKKELGELWQMSYSTNNKKPISLDKEIKLGAKCKKWIPRGKLIYQNWEFDIQNKSFYGEVRCAISNLPALSK